MPSSRSPSSSSPCRYSAARSLTRRRPGTTEPAGSCRRRASGGLSGRPPVGRRLICSECPPTPSQLSSEMIKKKFHYEMAKARSRRISRGISRRIKDIPQMHAWEYLGELSCRRAGRSSDGSVTTQLQRSELSSPTDIITGACSPRMRCHTLRARRAISPRRDIFAAHAWLLPHRSAPPSRERPRRPTKPKCSSSIYGRTTTG